MTEQEDNFIDGKQIKRLPRDASGKIKRVFTANGNKYKILNSDAIMSPEKYALFGKMSVAFSFNMGIESILKHHDELDMLILDIDAMNSLKKKAAILKNEAIRNGILAGFQSRFDSTLALCTLFIVRENEDITTYDDVLADEKIEDWQAEGLSMEDFFTLVVCTVPNFMTVWKDLTARIQSNDIGII